MPPKELTEPLVGKRLTLADGRTGTVTSVRENVIGVVLDGSATIIFVPRENSTPERLQRLTRNVQAAMRNRARAEVRLALLVKRTTAPSRHPSIRPMRARACPVAALEAVRSGHALQAD
jgi:hypothetical protein